MTTGTALPLSIPLKDERKAAEAMEFLGKKTAQPVGF
jgi:hypothetical protein